MHAICHIYVWDSHHQSIKSSFIIRLSTNKAINFTFGKCGLNSETHTGNSTVNWDFGGLFCSVCGFCGGLSGVKVILIKFSSEMIKRMKIYLSKGDFHGFDILAGTFDNFFQRSLTKRAKFFDKKTFEFFFCRKYLEFFFHKIGKLRGKYFEFSKKTIFSVFLKSFRIFIKVSNFP